MVSVVLAGCAPSAVIEVETASTVAAPPRYATNLPPPGANDNWWLGFDDPILDALVERSLSENLDVATARARVLRAAALLRAERSDRLPSFDGVAEAGVALSTDSRVEASTGLFSLFNPDISGRLAAEIRAAAADYAQNDYLLADQRRLVAAATAMQYVEYRRAGAQLALLEESTGLQEQTLRVVTLRFGAGLAANLDVRRAATDLAQTQARRGLIEIDRANAANVLAVLIAEPPGTFAPPSPIAGISEATPEATIIPNYALGPPAGTPADLLRRRTDVLAAEAALVRAAANISAERADLYPTLVIPGSLGIGDGSLGGIFSDFLTSLGASLDLPLFDGGRRRAEITAARAETDARLAEYRQTFLIALGEVENALVAIDAYRQRIGALEEAIEQSETALSQSNALYREGLTSLFDVLDAQRQLIASRQSLIDSEANLASAYIAFHAAVGSTGYERSRNLP